MKEFSASDLILEGLAYTVMGMLVVFAVLIIIMLVIKAMALFSKEEAPAAEKPGARSRSGACSGG